MSYKRLKEVIATLQHLSQAEREKIIQNMALKDPALAKAIKEKMFAMDQFHLVDNQGLRELIKQVPDEKWALAFRKVPETAKQHLYYNISQRRAKILEDLVESMGPQPLSKVQEAQQEIIDIILKLRDEGKLHIKSPNEDDPWV